MQNFAVHTCGFVRVLVEKVEENSGVRQAFCQDCCVRASLELSQASVKLLEVVAVSVPAEPDVDRVQLVVLTRVEPVARFADVLPHFLAQLVEGCNALVEMRDEVAASSEGPAVRLPYARQRNFENFMMSFHWTSLR